MKKILLSLTALAATTINVLAYDVNPIITAMPALTIAPDAHAAGMGDIGAATTPDMNSQYWNAAKYAFIEDKGGISVSYTPWLRKLVNDIDLAYLTGFYRFDDLQAISASFTYFSMGEVSLVQAGMAENEYYEYATAKPNEWSLDVAYSRKLHEYVSMAATLRFMYSDLNNGYNSTAGSYTSEELYPAWTFAADVSLYYRQPIELPMGTSHLAVGFIISNLGGKMSYKQSKQDQNFIPAKLRLGVSYEIPFDNYNRLMASVECDRTMAPSTYSKYATELGSTTGRWTDCPDKEAYSKLSSPKGWFQSFNDAPGGTAEEFKEMRWGVGLEYSYNRQFFGRVGYSHEDKMKGNRRYVTLGAGFKLSIVRFDVAYCIATAASNPLDQTMRFTLGFDLAGIKDLVNNQR